MQAYYSGVDEFFCISNQREANSAIKVKNNFMHLIFDLNKAVYRKSSSKFNWFAVGFGFAETEIFPTSLKITKVVLQSSKILGLSEVDSSLYYVVSKFDEIDKVFTWTHYSEIKFQKCPDVKLTDIAGSEGSEDLLAVDDQGGIYCIGIQNLEFHLELLFNLENHKIKKIVCGYDHKMVLTETGAIYAWGIGSRGQLGLFEILLNCRTPTRVEFFDDLPCIVSDIACGGWHVLALSSDGDIYSWGWNESGQLGHPGDNIPTVVANPYPVDLGSRENPVIAISAGSRHSAAILKNGDCFTWGWNKYGQLSLGSTENKSTPTKINSEFGEIGKISCARWGTVLYVKHKSGLS